MSEYIVTAIHHLSIFEYWPVNEMAKTASNSNPDIDNFRWLGFEVLDLVNPAGRRDRIAETYASGLEIVRCRLPVFFALTVVVLWWEDFLQDVEVLQIISPVSQALLIFRQQVPGFYINF